MGFVVKHPTPRRRKQYGVFEVIGQQLIVGRQRTGTRNVSHGEHVGIVGSALGRIAEEGRLESGWVVPAGIEDASGLPELAESLGRRASHVQLLGELASFGQHAAAMKQPSEDEFPRWIGDVEHP